MTSSGASILTLFAGDAEVYFPKWGLASGKEQMGKLFDGAGGTLKSIKHIYAGFDWIMTGSGLSAREGTSYGEHQDSS